MDSSDLLEIGISRWFPFNPHEKEDLLKLLPKKYGVYFIRKNNKFGRFIGESDIVYIGSTIAQLGLHQRIQQYFQPEQTKLTNIRVNSLINKYNYLELGFIVSDTKNAAREIEKNLLQKYDQEHGELPPSNRKG